MVKFSNEPKAAPGGERREEEGGEDSDGVSC